MGNLLSCLAAWPDRLRTDRRGTVATIVGLAATALFAVTALGLEVATWSVGTIELQTRADLTAFAAATLVKNGSSAQTAATTAANVAALNGAAAANCGWSGATNTEACSDVSISLVSGVVNATDQAMKVVTTRSIPLVIGPLFTTQTAVTVSATSIAEITVTFGSGGGGVQPCITTLSTSGVGVNVQGGTSVLSGCSIRSNSGVTVANGASITAPYVYANGTVTIGGGSQITTGGSNPSTVTPNTVGGWTNAAPLYESAGTISDPYANDSAIQNAFAELSPGQGTAWSGTWQPSTLNPGTYASITSGSGNITLNPGTYIVNGNISVGNGASFSNNSTAGGVTIIMSGTMTLGGGSTVTLNAPASTSSVGIPGVLIAGNGTGTWTLGNGAVPTLTGLLYYPHGQVSVAGGVGVKQGCLELVANSLSVTNGASLSSFSAACSNYGDESFPALPPTPIYTVALVQ
jgi:hypothetical protein